MATLKQIELGMPIAHAAHQLGVSEQAIYRWKKKYDGLESDQVRELKVLQEENARLKRLVTDLSLDKVSLQDINSGRDRRPRDPAQSLTDGGAIVNRLATVDHVELLRCQEGTPRADETTLDGSVGLAVALPI